jgi:orotidine-5'-phosphate decarboxylase
LNAREGAFKQAIREASKNSESKIILALDLDYRPDVEKLLTRAEEILSLTRDYICGVKVNWHLIAPLSLSELEHLNGFVSASGLPSIADIKLNDIDNTNRVATEYLWQAGFSAVIVNPFVGYEGGLDVVIRRAHELGKGVIALSYMSHKGAEEGYGLKLEDGRTLYELFLDRAKSWNVDGVIMGTTRPEKIVYARKRLGRDILILSPGSGAQGGDAIKSLEAGADYLIFGRSIVDAENPGSAAKRIRESLLPWLENH